MLERTCRSASSAERFDYDYPETELLHFVVPLEAVAQRAKSVHVVFNNNFVEQGQRDAAPLLRLFDAAESMPV